MELSRPSTFPNRQALAAAQLDRLRHLVEALGPHNRFYERNLAGLDRAALTQDLAGFSQRCPFTTKAQLTADQRDNPPYGTNLCYPMERYTRFHQTSGTTGHPLRWLDTPEDWEHLTAGWMEVLLAAGITARDRVLFAFTFGPFLGFWMAFDAAHRLGCLCLPAGGLSSAARVRLLLDNEVSVLCCTPTYAARLAEVASAEHLDLRRARVRILVVAGEPGGSLPAVRERLSRLWNGARVFDHHGMTEVGPVTFECPVTPGRLHVIESAFLPEIVDPDTGAAVGSGEQGELVLTPLQRTGMPLLRYRTGDLVRAASPSPNGAPCACGRHDLALEGGILGRADDMVIVRGVNVFPAAIEGVLQRCGAAEYQVEVFTRGSRSELTLRFEAAADAGPPSDVARRIQQELHHSLTLRIPVTPVPPGSLPRFEMKARRWIRTGAEPDSGSL